MKALAVFHGHGNHPLAPLLRPGFKHCFVVVANKGYWIKLDGMIGVPTAEVVTGTDYDLAQAYRDAGFGVVETMQRGTPPRTPVVVNNCVGLVKTVLAIRAPFVVTPYQLYRYLRRQP